MTTLEIAELATPLGAMHVAARDGRLCALSFHDHWERRRATLERQLGAVAFRSARDPHGFVSRLRAYFAGAVDALEGIPADPIGTAFQRRVWRALRDIAPGRTSSYGALARAIGAPSAVRAVGAANGANPVAIVIPCHRVIGADGRLVGYAGGVDRKRWLLEHERVLLPSDVSIGA